jgi:hypothetical protein
MACYKNISFPRLKKLRELSPRANYEVSANFYGNRVERGQRDGFLRQYARLSRPEPLLFLPSTSSSSIVLTGLSGLHSRPTISQKIWYLRESNPDLWLCSQDH